MKENEMIHTSRVLIVEGKYDAARLSHLTDAMILLTDGFGIYSDKKRQQLFKALAQKNGLILLTDSDAAGFRIRTYITNLVGEKNVVQAYVPAIHGKEKRKEQPGKEGLLGVEGVDDAIVLQALRDALGAEVGAASVRPEGRDGVFSSGRLLPRGTLFLDVVLDIADQLRNFAVVHIAGVEHHVVTGRVQNGQHAQRRLGIHAEFIGLQGDLSGVTTNDVAEMLRVLHAVDLYIDKHTHSPFPGRPCDLRSTICCMYHYRHF